MRLVIGGGVAVFALGAIFWAGAAYARLDGMQRELSNINAAISTLNSTLGTRTQDISELKVQQVENERRINNLEDLVRKLK